MSELGLYHPEACDQVASVHRPPGFESLFDKGLTRRRSRSHRPGCQHRQGRSRPDVAVSDGNCAGANGLSGDNLLCVDFDKVTQLIDAALTGLNFHANTKDSFKPPAGVAGGEL